MKKTLVINCGSSSLKFELFESGKEPKSLAEGLIDKIGTPDCRLTYKSCGKQAQEAKGDPVPTASDSELDTNKKQSGPATKYNKNLGVKIKVKNHTEATKLVLETIEAPKEIDLIAHRVVHGGEKYSEPVKIDAKVIKTIKDLSSLAPLHNPINLEGIMACKKILPRTKQVAVFDTAFHQTLQPKAYLYAIPQELYTKHGIRRYGFHGTNHQYVTNKAINLLGNKPGLKIISVHLGNGSSITASISGKAVDTSMGFTPLEGIPMGTRCGSIDPAVVLEIQKLKRFTPRRADEFLNHECGLLGLSGISSDMREIYAASLKKDPDALLAIEHLSYQIAKHIGAYTAALNGLDALVFTGGMGEKAFYVREKVCNYLSHLKLELNEKKNKANKEKIHSGKSSIRVFVIKADEEYQIAKLT